jgi:hypothetical protein
MIDAISLAWWDGCIGKYALTTGLTACVACPRGRSTRGTDGASFCELCDIGSLLKEHWPLHTWRILQ